MRWRGNGELLDWERRGSAEVTMDFVLEGIMCWGVVSSNYLESCSDAHHHPCRSWLCGFGTDDRGTISITQNTKLSFAYTTKSTS